MICAVSVFWTLVVHPLHFTFLLSSYVPHISSLQSHFCFLEWLYSSSHLARPPHPNLAADSSFSNINNASPSSQSVYFLLFLRAPAQLIGLFIHQDESFNCHYRYSKRVIRHSCSLTSRIHSHTPLHSTPLPCPVLS